jgi:hypothetical protein
MGMASIIDFLDDVKSIRIENVVKGFQIICMR